MKAKIMFFLASLLFIVSCGKENTTPSIKKLFRSNHVSGSNIYFKTYEYDSQGRLIIINNSLGSLETYTYSDSKVTYRIKGGLDSITITYYLNSQGVAEKAIGTHDGKNDVYIFQYNSDKNILRSEITASDGYKQVATYIWVNGNNTNRTVTHYNVGVANPSTDRFESNYLSDKKNTLSNEFKGLDFLGKSDLNPVSLSIFNSSRGTTFTSNFNYQFNEEGYIIKNGNDTYTYK